MAMTLLQLQTQLAAKVDGEATAPAVGSDDWKLRGALLEEAQRDWSERFDWEVMRAAVTTTTTSGAASYALPSTFKRMERYVVISGANYPEVEPIEAAYMPSSNDNYFYVTGNENDGYEINVNPAPIAGPTTMTYAYYSYPAALSYASTVSPTMNPYFLIQSAYSRLLELDEDNRFPAAKAEAEAILQQMLENEMLSRFPSLKERRRIKTRQRMAEIIKKTTGSVKPIARQE